MHKKNMEKHRCRYGIWPKTSVFMYLGLMAVLITGCGAGSDADVGENGNDVIESDGSADESGDNVIERIDVVDEGGNGAAERGDIVILYTNDVHCAADTNLGYATLAAYKEYMEEATPYVALVDCGDAVQGDPVGSISEGEYPIDFMNQVGYDYAILGNHEFDYGMEQLSDLISQSNATYLGCNITYTGEGENALAAVKPYEIVHYGDVDVAYIGVTTPESISQSTPSTFMDENGSYIYGFSGASGEDFCTVVQENIDECKEQGAEYVVLLAHLGTDEVSEPYRSTDLIAGTKDVDVVLDGHSHSVISCEYVNNKDGEKVLLSSTGTKLNYIGQLMITKDGLLTTTLISTYPDQDQTVTAYISDKEAEFDETLGEVVAYTDVKLRTNTDGGIRLVRIRETNLGDLCADAYRVMSGADIAFINGGGIRAEIESGDITNGDILSVNPFGNSICVAKVSGQEVLDALEMSCKEMQAQTDDGQNAIGEYGGFQQVSGLRFTVDTSVEPALELDENGMFVSCGNIRRVKDVEVLNEGGDYVPIDPDGEYTLATTDYLIKEGGDGLNMFMDNELVIDGGLTDYQVLIDYITEYLDGTVGAEYEQPQGRIMVE